MTPAEKKQFIADLCDAVRDSLLADADRLPDEWDGHELRALVVGRFHERGSWIDMDKRRLKSFRNEIVTRNL